ncbi:ImmA/IrrE family metallo-endopeptidase [Sphingomonas sp.]|jgi:HTH-type transcriptional regulator/antitoxin HigA|uniref:ImmA/IrrE family metallo-endopeptidase n=1 Tax=Sphingomonas sp. TaxID=28214 RepID=UPI002E300D0D|nr:ImmA/IrrE family metallo-endopeptidase [Sphingomonas sp.]HEX4694832.1 ImmA/IrrE family metallo-endopeptidase [Sphingomonas sp.]
MTIDTTECRTPGQLIEALLAERGWTKRTLAIVLAVDETTVAKWTSDRQPVNANIAVLLEEAFDVPAERFLELQRSYDLVKARHVARPDPGRKNRAHLFGGLPIAEMIKRCWIDAEDARDVSAVERSLAKFFGVPTVDEIPILPHAAKKRDVGPEVTPPQLAWLYRVSSIASGMLVAPYSAQAVKAAVSKLALLRQSPEELRKVPRILAEAGIRFVIVQTLESAKIDGVCFWLDDRSPVIGMSLRYDRIDNFWFVLRHELQHVIERHGLTLAVIDAELEGAKAGTGADIPEEERIANEAAAEFCVPDAQMNAFIVRKAPFYSERDLLGFARTIGVHPGLVAGQLQRRTERYDRFRNHLVKIRNFVSPGAMVDGWGDVAPID